MIIDVKKLMQSGKTEEDFFFEYAPAGDVVTVPGVEIAPPVKVLGTVMLTSDKTAVIDAEITFTLKGECTRCLGPAENTYTVTFSEEFVQGGGDGVYGITNDKIDLTKPVDDQTHSRNARQLFVQ